MSNTFTTVESSSGVPERRIHARRQTTSLAYVDLGEDNGGLVLNVSEGGIAVHAAVMLAGDQLPKIRFQLPQSLDWIESAGQVSWTGNSRKSAGIEFVGLPDDAREQIRNWLGSTDPPYEPPSVRRRTIDRRKLAALASLPADGDTPDSAAPPAEDTPKRNQVAESVEARSTDPASAADPPCSVPSTPLPVADPVAGDAGTEIEATAMAAAPVRTRRWPINPGLSWNAQPAEVSSDPPLVHRNWLLLAGVAGLLVAASFTIGLATGRRAWTGILSSPKTAPESSAAPATTERSEPAANGTNGAREPAAGAPGPTTAAVGAAPAGAAGNAERTAASQSSIGSGAQPGNGEPAAQALTVHRQAPSQLGGGGQAAVEDHSGSVLAMPDTPVSASDSVAVSSRLYVPVPAAAGTPGRPQRPGNVRIGRLESRVDIVYPPDAAQQHIEGIVKLHVTIGTDGAISSAAPMSGAPSLAAAALDAVRQWRYQPTTMDGRPIETEADITAVFRLPQTQQ